jgi:hypothetical protein
MGSTPGFVFRGEAALDLGPEQLCGEVQARAKANAGMLRCAQDDDVKQQTNGAAEDERRTADGR